MRQDLVGVLGGKLAGLLELGAELRRALRRRYPANPIRQARFRIHRTTRQLRLRLRPRGVFAAFLGPDGSGKSSLTDLLVERLGGHADVLEVRRVYLGSGQPLLRVARILLAAPRRADGGKRRIESEMVRDPVCGTWIDRRLALSAGRNGNSVAVCSEKCLRALESR